MNYKKILKKVGERFEKGPTFGKIQGSTLKRNVGLTKSYIKACIKRVGGMGVMFAAVFVAVWAVLPANGAEAAN